jgi:hypothetical protein
MIAIANPERPHGPNQNSLVRLPLPFEIPASIEVPRSWSFEIVKATSTLRFLSPNHASTVEVSFRHVMEGPQFLERVRDELTIAGARFQKRQIEAMKFGDFSGFAEYIEAKMPDELTYVEYSGVVSAEKGEIIIRASHLSEFVYLSETEVLQRILLSLKLPKL